MREKSNRDYAELRELRRKDIGDPDAGFHAWDYWYYAVDMEVIRQYFPLPTAIKGMLEISSILYGLEFKNATKAAKAEGLYFWHPDVEFWRIYDKETGKLVSELYTDFHPRPFKRGGAFFWDFVPHKTWMDGSVTTMRGVLQCNFPRPTEDKPSLLTHDDVTTLFHEFGHALHATPPPVSG